MKLVTKRLISSIQHQNIGGKEFVIDFEVSKEEVEKVSNYASMNFVLRRSDFLKLDFNKKMYYGHVDGLGYIVCEDEFTKKPTLLERRRIRKYDS